MGFCVYCGSRLNAGSSFCSSCGAATMEDKRFDSFEYVGFWPRFLAAIIDNIVNAIVVVVLPIPILPVIATILLWIFNQATLGKMVIQAKIVDARTMQAPSAGQCIIRYLFLLIISFVTCGLGTLSIEFDENKRGWHDKVAGTAVIRPKQGSSQHYPLVEQHQDYSRSSSGQLDDIEQFFHMYSFEDPSKAHEIWMELPTRSKAIIVKSNPEAADVMRQVDEQLREIEEDIMDY